MAYSIHIDRKAVIGRGLYIGHFAGIVVERCRLGKNCSIHQHVHIEEDLVDGRTSGPWIGDNVWIGPHARIKGPVQVGNNAAIAAGAVVTSDVQDGCLVSGDPAWVISLKYDNAALLGGHLKSLNPTIVLMGSRGQHADR